MKIYLNKGINALNNQEIDDALKKGVSNFKIAHSVLLIPPDYTRYHSYAGHITNFYYHYFLDQGIDVDILPALGTHIAMNKEEVKDMYGDIPFDKFIYHDWRNDVVKIGEIPEDYVNEISEGLWKETIDVEVNKRLLDPKYDLIISIGQVVPHEVVGFANHAKNIFVGVGGKNMINSSHIVGAVYGMERMMGRDHSPVRKMFDYASEHYLKNVPLIYALTVTSNNGNILKVHGLFIGQERKALEEAISLSKQVNINYVDKGLKKCLVYLDPKEFKSTWLGNKAIYRTRMAMANESELIVLAPGVEKFGEDKEVDKLIRKYGYVGRLRILDLFIKNYDLRENQSAAAHLIHGSSDDRFNITYAVKKISKEEIKSVNFIPADYDEIFLKYQVDSLKPGYNLVNGEEIYYIPNPALGLWINKERM